MRNVLLYMLFLFGVLISCAGHSHGADSAPGADSLSVQVYDARYRDAAMLDALSRNLDSLAANDHELAMVATNAMA